MKLRNLLFATTAFATLVGHGVALGDDWTADRLRGIVMQLDGTDWRPVVRGEVISDDRHIRTLASGRVEFVRGAERISVGGDTDIQISDATGRRMTTVKQLIGTVSIEAEHKNVQHFSVLTPYLAAIVKGTRFTVRIRDGATRVNVDRGVVEVHDRVHEVSANVGRGQAASVSDYEVLEVSGPGASTVMTTDDGKFVERKTVVAHFDNLANEQSGDDDNEDGHKGGNKDKDKDKGGGHGNSGGKGYGNGGGGGHGNGNGGGNGNGHGWGNSGGNGHGNSGNSGGGSHGGGGNGNGNSGNSGGGGNGNGNGGNSGGGGHGNGNGGGNGGNNGKGGGRH
ncbi:FecR family protein [Devosia algicola]|uniref:FecR family protein n=1 Tax=Devosia algicola TaxID=3026418 RepID=A0ABY7YRT6_9HYPH|nr:FecR family protein [Devosia algicola]WDR04043.1 FecR family protein [Devosia algicola]